MLTHFVIADSADATSILNAPSHNTRWPALETNGVDNAMLAALWRAISPNAPTEKLEGDEFIVEQASGGPWVFCLPQELLHPLAEIEDAEFSSIASRWAEQDEPRYANCQADDLEAGLRQLAPLAKQAVAANKSFFLWMSM